VIRNLGRGIFGALALLAMPAFADDAPLRLQVPQNSRVTGTVDGANATARTGNLYHIVAIAAEYGPYRARIRELKGHAERERQRLEEERQRLADGLVEKRRRVEQLATRREELEGRKRPLDARIAAIDAEIERLRQPPPPEAPAGHRILRDQIGDAELEIDNLQRRIVQASNSGGSTSADVQALERAEARLAELRRAAQRLVRDAQTDIEQLNRRLRNAPTDARKAQLRAELERRARDLTALNDVLARRDRPEETREARIRRLQQEHIDGLNSVVYRDLTRLLQDNAAELARAHVEVLHDEGLIDDLLRRIAERDGQIAILAAQAEGRQDQQPAVTGVLVEVDLPRVTVYRADYEVDPAIVRRLEDAMSDYASRANDVRWKAQQERWERDRLQRRRAALLPDLERYGYEAIEANDRLQEFLYSNTTKRFWVNLLSEEVEVLSAGVEGGLAGIVAEFGGKVAEAIFVNNWGRDDWRPYDPSQLIGLYQGATAGLDYNPFGGDFAKNTFYRAMIDLTGEAALRVREGGELSRQLHNAVLDREVARAAARRADTQFAQAFWTLIAAEDEFLQAVERQAAAGALEQSLNAVRAARPAVTAARVITSNLATTLAEVESKAGKALSALKAFDARRVALETGTGIVRGVAYDAMRLAFHTYMDQVEKEAWEEYLEADAQARGIARILQHVTAAYITASNSIAAKEATGNLFATLWEEARATRERYLAHAQNAQNLHVLTDEHFGGREFPIVVTVKTRGSDAGETVLLRGPSGQEIALESLDYLPEPAGTPDARIAAHLEAIAAPAERRYVLREGDLARLGGTELTLVVRHK
jgi:hypothetical protein